MKKVSVIGHYAFGFEYLDGQTVKTKIITEELCKNFGEEEVLRFDTHGGMKTLVKSPFIAWNALKNSRNVIILPAHNGLRIFGHLLPLLKTLFKGRKIHYVVIGGWLPKILESKKRLANILKKFDGIYVETNTMRRALESQGFENIYILPNCKKLMPLSADELTYHEQSPYKLCTFSRVMQEKGVEDAIDAVKAVNEKFGKIVYTLDIYGQVDAGQIEWFDNLKTNFPQYVNYKGLVPFDKSVEVLKEYFALLFPTRFYTEGIPGTIIDAYAAGIPVISAKWQSFSDIIEDGVTGVGYEFGNTRALTNKLFEINEDIDNFNRQKIKCLEKSKYFIPGHVIEVIIKELC